MDFDWSPAISAGAALVAACLAGLALLANRRSAAAAELSAQAAQDAVAMAREVRWQITRPDRLCRLTNLGRDSAYGVRVEADSLVGSAVWDHIDGGEVVEFQTARAFGDSNASVVIWHQLPDRSDPPRRRRFALPTERP